MNGELIPFRRDDDDEPERQRKAPDPEQPPRRRFEHALDDDPDEPQLIHPPGGFGLPVPDPDRRPVVPPALRSLKTARKELARRSEPVRYGTAFHGLRAPLYLLLAVVWAVVGVFRLKGRLWRYVMVSEMTPLLAQAVADGDSREYRALQGQWRRVHEYRLILAGVGSLAALVAGILITVLVPLAWIAVGAVAVPLLARAGRPAHRPIITPSMTEPTVRVISQDTLIRAYAAAGLCKPGTEGQELGLGVMARDCDGTAATVFLPHGKTFADAVTAKAKIASGLDVKIQQVYLTEDPVSERRHRIWIADEDPLAIFAGRTPLLDLKRRNVWRDLFPMGLDHYGRKVAFCLLWISILIGAQPRKGKTFTARAVALFCALDPHVRITVADGSAKPDWRSFRLVAHRTIFGTRPTRDGDPAQKLLDELRAIEKHIEDTGNFLSTLDVSECPEGKLTEALCRKYPRKLFLWLLVMEEAYFYYETDDQEVNKDVAQRLSNIRAAGPALGVILITSLQKPAGVGAGQDVQRLFTRYRDNHDVRIALKCGNRSVSEAVLGGDAYSEGWDASALPDGKKYRGVSILYGHPDLEETLTVRAYLADGEDAEKILIAARRLREQAGTLTGEAADEDLSVPSRDVLADVLAMFNGGEPALHWTVLADRLDERIPERWADITPPALTAQLRDLGVPSVPVTIARLSSRGCRREHVERAMRGDHAIV